MKIELVQKQLYKAFRRFNKNLFDGELPACLIEIHRHRRSELGHYMPRVWVETDEKGRVVKTQDEISLNPRTFKDRSTIQILSTLVHEMCHQYQFLYGSPSKRGYHNKEFARIMRLRGLITSDTGDELGMSTGFGMSHYIDENGKFLKLAKKLVKEGMDFSGFAILPYKKDRSKTKHTCPECEINAWSNKNIKLICGFCQIPMITQN